MPITFDTQLTCHPCLCQNSWRTISCNLRICKVSNRSDQFSFVQSQLTSYPSRMWSVRSGWPCSSENRSISQTLSCSILDRFVMSTSNKRCISNFPTMKVSYWKTMPLLPIKNKIQSMWPKLAPRSWDARFAASSSKTMSILRSIRCTSREQSRFWTCSSAQTSTHQSTTTCRQARK